MTILDLVQHDHEQVALLMSELATANERQRAELATKLERAVAHNMRIDHALLYEALDQSGAREAREQLQADERQLLTAFAQLRDGLDHAVADDDWRRALADVQRLVGRHAEWETGEVFPLARQLIDDAALERLFHEAERRKHRQSLKDSLIFPADRFGIE